MYTSPKDLKMWVNIVNYGTDTWYALKPGIYYFIREPGYDKNEIPSKIQKITLTSNNTFPYSFGSYYGGSCYIAIA